MSSLRLPPEVCRLLERCIERPGPAVFDADGTLWRGDVGEDLLRYLAAEGMVRRTAFAEYERLVEVDAPGAYAFAVEVMAGLEERWLERVCAEFFDRRYSGRVYPWVAPVFAYLGSNGCDVWLCSASPRWIVEAGGVRLKVDRRRILGVDAEVELGLLTGRVKHPITCGPGKVLRLREQGVEPALAFGDGERDLDLLASARLAVVVAPFDGPANALVQEAPRRGWVVLRT